MVTDHEEKSRLKIKAALATGDAETIESVLIDVGLPHWTPRRGDMYYLQQAIETIRAQDKWPDRLLIKPSFDWRTGIQRLISASLVTDIDDASWVKEDFEERRYKLLEYVLSDYREERPEKLESALNYDGGISKAVWHRIAAETPMLAALLMDHGLDPAGSGIEEYDDPKVLLCALHNDAWTPWFKQEGMNPEKINHVFTRISDMLSQFRDRVMLPELMLQLGQQDNPDFFDHTDVDLDRVKVHLTYIAARGLLRDLEPEGVIALVDRWHDHMSIPESLLTSLANREWKPLHDPFTASNGLTIECLTHDYQLREESRQLHHCVGDSDYGNKCSAMDDRPGEVHILSVRDQEGNSLSTLEVQVHKKLEFTTYAGYTPVFCRDYILSIPQHYGRDDGLPPQESEAAVKEWQKALQNGELKLRLSSYDARVMELGPVRQEHGQEEPAIYQTIGYRPTEAHASRVLHALGENVRYVTGVQQVDPVYRRVKEHETMGGEPYYKNILVSPGEGRVAHLRSLIHGEGTSSTVLGVRFSQGKDGKRYNEMTASEYLEARDMDLASVIERHFSKSHTRLVREYLARKGQGVAREM